MGEQQTLNSGESSPSSHYQSDELISTVELATAARADTDPGEAKNTRAQTTEPASTDGNVKEDATKTDGGSDKDADAETRFDKHPRFVELNRRVKGFDEENRRLREELEQVKSSIPAQKKEPDPPPYKDWSNMSEEELLDWQSTDPKGFLENVVKQSVHTARSLFGEYVKEQQQQTQQKTQQDAVISTYEAYAKDNPDFDSMWDNGEIKAYMDKNPGHNPLSAHMAMTADTRAQRAADKALKEYETAQRTKRASSVLGAGPATVPTEPRQADDRLKNPKKYGGITQVLTDRLFERRRAAT